MATRCRVLGLTVCACLLATLTACTPIAVQERQTRVIAHRGASGYLPEHTLEAYAAAYFMGADLIEPDVIATRDGQLICMHDLHLETVTDAALRFPDRARADGHWYAIDFDLNEITSLNVHGRGDGQWEGFQIPTFEQMLVLIHRLNQQTGRRVGVVPELKDPDFHTRAGFDIASAAVSMIERTGWDTGVCMIQCFDPKTLQALHRRHGKRLSLLQLISDPEKVPSLEEIADYASGIGPSRKVIDADPEYVKRAQALGLLVFPYTFNDEPEALIRYGNDLRVDAVFANYPDIAAQALEPR